MKYICTPTKSLVSKPLILLVRLDRIESFLSCRTQNEKKKTLEIFVLTGSNDSPCPDDKQTWRAGWLHRCRSRENASGQARLRRASPERKRTQDPVSLVRGIIYLLKSADVLPNRGLVIRFRQQRQRKSKLTFTYGGESGYQTAVMWQHCNEAPAERTITAPRGTLPCQPPYFGIISSPPQKGPSSLSPHHMFILRINAFNNPCRSRAETMTAKNTVTACTSTVRPKRSSCIFRRLFSVSRLHFNNTA